MKAGTAMKSGTSQNHVLFPDTEPSVWLQLPVFTSLQHLKDYLRGPLVSTH